MPVQGCTLPYVYLLMAGTDLSVLVEQVRMTCGLILLYIRVCINEEFKRKLKYLKKNDTAIKEMKLQFGFYVSLQAISFSLA